MRRSGKEAEYVGFVVAVQIYYEIKLRLTHAPDELDDLSDRDQRRTITQRNTIDFQDLVRVTGKIDQFGARLSDCDGDVCIRETRTNRAQRRQAHHHVAELTKIDYQDVAWIKCHVLGHRFNGYFADYPLPIRGIRGP